MLACDSFVEFLPGPCRGFLEITGNQMPFRISSFDKAGASLYYIDFIGGYPEGFDVTKHRFPVQYPVCSKVKGLN